MLAWTEAQCGSFGALAGVRDLIPLHGDDETVLISLICKLQALS